MKKAAFVIRIVTVAPFMALCMLLALTMRNPLLFEGTVNFVLLILFLVVFPLLGYPLQPLLKKYKDRGREGQRTLAMYFAVAGYVGGCLSAAILNVPKVVWIIYLCYLFSGALIVLFNKLFGFKASGHACGVAGPVAMLLYLGHPLGYLGIPVLALVWISSLTIGRHTNSQLIGGTAIPVVSLGIAVLILSVF